MKRLLLILSAIVFCGVVCFAGPKIYINPGHGGYNSNDRNIVTINHASGDHNGFWESQANLTKGLFLRDMLQTAGATVYMSRTDDCQRSLQQGRFFPFHSLECQRQHHHIRNELPAAHANRYQRFRRLGLIIQIHRSQNSRYESLVTPICQ